MKFWFVYGFLIVSIMICKQSVGDASIIMDGNSMSHPIENRKIKLIIGEIPEEERDCLDKLFRNLITCQLVGFVIFGDKAMAWGDFSTKKFCVVFDKAKTFSYDSAWDDYLIWKKYEHMFPFKNYILRIYKSSYNEDYYHFLFINKKLFAETFRKNKDLFEEKLGNLITCDMLLHDLETKDNIIEKVFHRNEELLGICLGFGRHNSQIYQKREELDQLKGRPPFDFGKIKDIYKIKLTSFPIKEHENHAQFNFIQLPYFVEDKEHPESTQIRQKHLETQKRLCKIYSEGRFLEITLEALMSDTCNPR